MAEKSPQFTASIAGLRALCFCVNGVFGKWKSSNLYCFEYPAACKGEVGVWIFLKDI